MPLTSAQEAYLGVLQAQIGPTRISPYLRQTSGDLTNALAMYYWNVELCRTFYPALQALEITLRNNLDAAVRPLFPVAPGGARHLQSWLTRHNAVVVHPGGRDAVDNALGKLLGRDPVTRAIKPNNGKSHDDLVAAMSFGFWVGMLETAYDVPGTAGIFLWPTHKDTVFPGGTADTMPVIRASLNRIRQFRNRVFHHEPAWPKRATDTVPDDWYNELLKALRWLGSGHAQIVPTLHEKVSTVAHAQAVPDMAVRLIAAVDHALALAKKRKDEKAAVQAARKAAKAAKAANGADDTEGTNAAAPEANGPSPTAAGS